MELGQNSKDCLCIAIQDCFIALKGHCCLSIRYLQLDLNKSTYIIKYLRFVIKLMFSCINSKLRSQPV